MLHEVVELGVISSWAVRINKQLSDNILAYYWDNYCYFDRKRSIIISELKHSLKSHCREYSFVNWQRVVDYKFCLNPLSAKGSVLNDVGGRFNIGNLDQDKFPPFAALYIADGKDTAYKEKFGLNSIPSMAGITPEEMILTAAKPTTDIVIEGKIHQTLNLTTDTLKDFYELIKDITLPPNLVKRAKQLNLKLPMSSICSLSELNQNIFMPTWRDIPMLADIPAPSQILGQIAYAAGVEAILFPSTITKKSCLAIYPKNFENSESFIKLVGELPAEVKNSHLDCKNFSLLV